MEKVGSSILFSASFSPLDYYQEVLGGGEDSLTYRLPSPFPNENRLVLVDASIQTTYQMRTQSIPKIAASIERLVKQNRQLSCFLSILSILRPGGRLFPRRLSRICDSDSGFKVE